VVFRISRHGNRQSRSIVKVNDSITSSARERPIASRFAIGFHDFAELACGTLADLSREGDELRGFKNVELAVEGSNLIM